MAGVNAARRAFGRARDLDVLPGVLEEIKCDADIRAALMRAIGVETKWSSPEETRAWIDTQLNQFSEIIPAAGIKPE